MRYAILLIFLATFLSLGCSNEGNDSSEKRAPDDHVWRDQVRTMDRAREVETVIDKSVEEQRKIIETQSR
jgi:hypothetical protein